MPDEAEHKAKRRRISPVSSGVSHLVEVARANPGIPRLSEISTQRKFSSTHFQRDIDTKIAEELTRLFPDHQALAHINNSETYFLPISQTGQPLKAISTDATRTGKDTVRITRATSTFHPNLNPETIDGDNATIEGPVELSISQMSPRAVKILLPKVGHNEERQSHNGGQVAMPGNVNQSPRQQLQNKKRQRDSR